MASTDKTTSGSGDSVSAASTPSETKPKKRYKTVRTAIRHLLARSTRQAIGRLGDTTDGLSRKAVGSSTVEIETRPQAGSHRPNKKHVRVDVVMTVSEHGCTCSDPVTPAPLPLPVKKVRQWYWWVSVPILGWALWYGPGPFNSTAVPQRPPAVALAGTIASEQAPSQLASAKPEPVETESVSTGAASGTGKADGPLPAPSTGLSALGCTGLTGQLINAPDYAQVYVSGWVKARATTWFVKRLPRCSAQVIAYDLKNRVINVQDYDDSRTFTGQRIYVFGQDQVQIDAYDVRNQFAGRTVYQYSGSPVQRVSLAFRFDANELRTFEAQINRNNDGSVFSLTVWSFCFTDSEHQSVHQKLTITNPQQIAADLAEHFYQFPEFQAGTW